MISFLKNRFALSDKGAQDLVKAVISCALTDMSFMFPVGLLYYVLKAITAPYVGNSDKLLPTYIYVGISIILLGVIWFFERNQYNATFLASYEESANQRITIAEKLRKIPLSFFGKRDLADLTSTIMADCAGMETAFSHYIPQLLGSIISVVLVGIGLLTFNWKLAVALLWVVPVSFVIVKLSKNKQNKINKMHNDLKIERAASIQECLETVKEIKANNQSKRYLIKVDKLLSKTEKMNFKAEFNTAVYVMSAQMLLRVGVATLILTGAKLIASNEIDFMTFLMFLIASSRVFDPLAVSLQNLAAIFNTELQVDRMKNINNHKIQQGEKDINFNNYDIEFKHVEFAYEDSDNEKVLKDVNFIAKQGEITALVGPSGGGKSTVSKLAARFWDVNKGQITIGGRDISTVDPEELLKSYSIVFQNVVLFNNTIMENIRLGRRGATDEEVMNAAKMAMCDDFIKKMPDGYNTVIGENGCTLSGGERQRISIARALLKDSPIVLLDEATASLDVENESKVQKAISTLVKNKTVLVIAHRMRTIAAAKHIVVLADGVVKEEGNHESLLNKKGLYNKLWTLQNKSASWTM